MVQVIRHYHGHLSGIYSLALHPNLDLLMTGGRDSVCRVWDMRSKVQAHVLSGHDDTVCSILSQASDPQVNPPFLDPSPAARQHDGLRLWASRCKLVCCLLIQSMLCTLKVDCVQGREWKESWLHYLFSEDSVIQSSKRSCLRIPRHACGNVKGDA